MYAPIYRLHRATFGLFFALIALRGTACQPQPPDAPTNPQKADVGIKETEDEKKERVAAERFLQVLKSRPRLGTALDKVFGYHTGRGSIDSFLNSLRAEATSTNNGNLWLIVGLIQTQRGKEGDAAEAYAKSEVLMPNEALPSYYLGKSLISLGEVDKGAEAMKRAIERNPPRADMLQISQDLGRIYQRTGKKEEARDVWAKLDAAFPNDSAIQEQIAVILDDEGADEEALVRFTSLSKLHKDRGRQVEMAVRAAQIKARLGRQQEAIADFSSQLSLVNPDSWIFRDIRHRIEQLYWREGNIRGLIEYYQDWVEKHPDDLNAMMRIAKSLANQNQIDEAKKWFYRAIEKSPNNAELRLALIDSLAADNDFSSASAEMEKLIALEPESSDHLIRWGQLVMSDQKVSEQLRESQAADIWKRLLNSHEQDPVMIVRVADLLRSIQRVDESIELYQKAIMLAPEEPQYREYLGEYFHILGRSNEAIETWNGIAADERRNRDNLVRLSEVLKTFNHTDQSMSCMLEACSMNPLFRHRSTYAAMLREAKKYGQSLEQWNLAESLVEDSEGEEQVIAGRIKCYVDMGQLVEQIERLQSHVQGEGKEDPKAWRLLALYLEENRQFLPACNAIEHAASLARESDIGIWHSAASLYEKSGRLGEALNANRNLLQIDRRFATSYLKQICALTMRLGLVEDALKAGEELLGVSTGNAESYRFYAELCVQAGQPAKGLDALRRNLRSNPKNASLLGYLAKTLSDDFQTDEAIEVYWRLFDLEKGSDSKKSALLALTDLYLRTNRLEILMDRLELSGRETNQSRNASLWIASVHRAAGDFGRARGLLEQLATQDGRDVTVFEQLVELSQEENDFESAIEYQKRLMAVAPTPQAEVLLASLLNEADEIDDAEAIWMRMGQAKRDTNDIHRSLQTLFENEQFATAKKLIERALQESPNDWELFVPAIEVYFQLGDFEAVRQIVAKVEDIGVAPATLTRSEMLEQQKRLSAINQGTHINRDELDLSEVRFVDQVSKIKEMFGQEQDYDFNHGNSSAYCFRRFMPICFGDVQLVSRLVLLYISNPEDSDAMRASALSMASELQKNPTAKNLWQALQYLEFCESNILLSQQSDQEVERIAVECLTALANQKDTLAVITLLDRKIPYQSVAITNDELDSFLETRKSVEGNFKRNVLDQIDVRLLDLLYKGERFEEGDAMISAKLKSLDSGWSVFQLGTHLMEGVDTQKPERKQDVIRNAVRLMQRGMALVNTKDWSSNRMISDISGQFDELLKHHELEAAFELFASCLEFQARKTSQLRPSEWETKQNSYGYERISVAFPTPSGFMNGVTISAVYRLNMTAKTFGRHEQFYEMLSKKSEQNYDDPLLKLNWLVAIAAVDYWSDHHESALKRLKQAEALGLGGSWVRIQRMQALVNQNDHRGALDLLMELKPTNQKMLVDRELSILELQLHLGDMDLARNSAQKLFALNLNSNTQLQLAELMYNLNMKDFGDRLMDRVKRRAGGQHYTLSRLMDRYLKRDDFQHAVEIARQLMRQAKPRKQNDSWKDQIYRESLTVLAKAEELPSIIEKTEAMLARSPRSNLLKRQLIEQYEVAGRRADAKQVREGLKEKESSDPQSLLEQANMACEKRQYKAALEKFLQAIQKSPRVLQNDSSHFLECINATNQWPTVLDLVLRQGIQKYRYLSVLSAMRLGLAKRRDHENLFRLDFAIVNQRDLSHVFSDLDTIVGLMDENSRPDVRVTERFIDRVLSSREKLFQVQAGYDNGYPTHGCEDALSLVSVHTTQANRFDELLAQRISDSPEDNTARAMLIMLRIHRKQWEGVPALVDPLLRKGAASPEVRDILLVICSHLLQKKVHLEHAANWMKQVSVASGSLEKEAGYNGGCSRLLAQIYHDLGNREEARRILRETLEGTEMDLSVDPRGGIEGSISLYCNRLIATLESMLVMGETLDTLIAIRKCLNSMPPKAGNRFYAQNYSRFEQLATKARESLSDEQLLSIVGAAGGRIGSEPLTDFVDGATQLAVQSDSALVTQANMDLEDVLSLVRKRPSVRKEILSWIESDNFLRTPTASLRDSVSRLLIANAIADAAGIEQAAQAIDSWLQQSNPGERQIALSMQHPKTKATDLPLDEELVWKISLSLPEDWILLVAARSLYEAPGNSKRIASWLSRVTQSATQINRHDVALYAQLGAVKNSYQIDPKGTEPLLRSILDMNLFAGRNEKPNGDVTKAAMRVAKIAAMQGQTKLSMEAVRKFVADDSRSPSHSLGGLLATEYQFVPAQDDNVAQILHEINSYWDQSAPANACYELWKELVLPSKHLRLAYDFPHRYDRHHEQNMLDDHSVINGIDHLVSWAKRADQLADLEATLMERWKATPSNPLLMEIQLRTLLELPVQESAERLERLIHSTNAEIFVENKTVTRRAVRLFRKLGQDSEVEKKFLLAILSASLTVERLGNSSLVEWIHTKLESVVRENDFPLIDRIGTLLNKQWYGYGKPTQVGEEMNFYLRCAKVALQQNNREGAKYFIGRQIELCPTSDRIGQFFDLHSESTNQLVQLSPQEQFELSFELPWQLPMLGLSQSAIRQPKDSPPHAFRSSIKDPPELIRSRQMVIGPQEYSSSLLEWMMRVAISIGRSDAISEKIQKLEKENSDDAILARIVLLKAMGEPIDFQALSRHFQNSPRPWLSYLPTDSVPLLLDLDILYQSISKNVAQPEAVQRLKVLCDLESKEAIILNGLFRRLHEPDLVTHKQFRHFVVSEDLSRSNAFEKHSSVSWNLDGSRALNALQSTFAQTLLFRYPLQGNYQIAMTFTTPNPRSNAGVMLGGFELTRNEIDKNNPRRQIVGHRGTNSYGTLKMDQTKFKIERIEATLQAQVSENEKILDLVDLHDDTYPFVGLQNDGRGMRVTEFSLTGSPNVPRSVKLLDPTLLGWSGYHHDQSLPTLRTWLRKPVFQNDDDDRFGSQGELFASDAPPPTKKQTQSDWFFNEGELQSNPPTKKERPRNAISESPDDTQLEGWIYYLRPLCDGEKLTFEFFYEPGVTCVWPTVDRIALCLEAERLGHHWITSDGGKWFGIPPDNLVDVPQNQVLQQATLRRAGWNNVSMTRHKDTVIVNVNGADVYSQEVDAEMQGRFGFFHNPQAFQVRVRNMELKGDWPEKIHDDLFELK